MDNKYTLNQITKALEKLFEAGFNSDKKILAMKLEDLIKIGNLTSSEIAIIIDYRMAVKNKQITAFLSGYKEKGTDNK